MALKYAKITGHDTPYNAVQSGIISQSFSFKPDKFEASPSPSRHPKKWIIIAIYLLKHSGEATYVYLSSDEATYVV